MFQINKPFLSPSYDRQNAYILGAIAALTVIIFAIGKIGFHFCLEAACGFCASVQLQKETCYMLRSLECEEAIGNEGYCAQTIVGFYSHAVIIRFEKTFPKPSFQFIAELPTGQTNGNAHFIDR